MSDPVPSMWNGAWPMPSKPVGGAKRRREGGRVRPWVSVPHGRHGHTGNPGHGMANGNGLEGEPQGRPKIHGVLQGCQEGRNACLSSQSLARPERERVSEEGRFLSLF